MWREKENEKQKSYIASFQWIKQPKSIYNLLVTEADSAINFQRSLSLNNLDLVLIHKTSGKCLKKLKVLWESHLYQVLYNIYV